MNVNLLSMFHNSLMLRKKANLNLPFANELEEIERKQKTKWNKINKYLELARKIEKNSKKLVVIQIVVLGSVHNGLDRSLKE